MQKISATAIFALASFLSIAHAESDIATTSKIENGDCLACHDAIDEQNYFSSVHGSNLCISCHSDIKELPHLNSLAPVNCSTCHKLEYEVYMSSDHGIATQKGEPAAACKSCHGDMHTLLSYRDQKSPVHRANIAKTCAVCHEDQVKMAQFSLLEEKPVTSYLATVHGKAFERGIMNAAVCTDCHGSHDLHAPSNPKSKLYKKNISSTCGKCHENVQRIYERSIHGRAALAGKWESPVCTDCHGEHTILSAKDPGSSVYAGSISVKTCGHCHTAEKITTKYRLPSDRLKTYLESYHGLAGKSGMTTVANCASCHGSHDILPSSSPNSSVNKNNLSKTCGKCHPNVGEQLAQGSIHLAPSPTRDAVVYYVSMIYIGLIIVTIGFMLLHNALDFRKKMELHRRNLDIGPHEIRFTMVERIQHAVLTVSFVVLAITGFALKFSDSWWALPFTAWNSQNDWRGMIHRGAAIAFTVLSIYHILYLIITQRGRRQFQELLFKRKDGADFIEALKYNLGFSAKKPQYGRYAYVEKVEYWALVWGSAVMIITGGMLTFDNIVMQFFPKWAIDVASTIHFYEAVLATLAVIIWHFYFTIFDPDCYPLNFSMFTGKAKPRNSDEPTSTQK